MCPPPPPLFIITAKLLALMIRNDQQLKGIALGNTEFRISQFADDATCFVESAATPERVVHIFGTFARFSGLKLNMNKSKALSLTKAEISTLEVAGLEVVSKTHILRVWFAKKQKTCRTIPMEFQTSATKNA